MKTDLKKLIAEAAKIINKNSAIEIVKRFYYNGQYIFVTNLETQLKIEIYEDEKNELGLTEKGLYIFLQDKFVKAPENPEDFPNLIFTNSTEQHNINFLQSDFDSIKLLNTKEERTFGTILITKDNNLYLSHTDGKVLYLRKLAKFDQDLMNIFSVKPLNFISKIANNVWFSVVEIEGDKKIVFKSAEGRNWQIETKEQRCSPNVFRVFPESFNKKVDLSMQAETIEKETKDYTKYNKTLRNGNEILFYFEGKLENKGTSSIEIKTEIKDEISKPDFNKALILLVSYTKEENSFDPVRAEYLVKALAVAKEKVVVFSEKTKNTEGDYFSSEPYLIY